VFFQPPSSKHIANPPAETHSCPLGTAAEISPGQIPRRNFFLPAEKTENPACQKA